MSLAKDLELSTMPGNFQNVNDVWRFLMREGPRFAQPKRGVDWLQVTEADLEDLFKWYVNVRTPADWFHLSDHDLVPLFSWLFGRWAKTPEVAGERVNERMAARGRVKGASIPAS